MPPAWKNQRAYDRLYDQIDPFGDYCERSGRTQIIRIPSGLTTAEVYQRLPSAEKFEYAGYLTATRIVYWKGDTLSSRFPTSKHCTFHSHPTSLKGFGDPDLPSLADIRSFVLGRNLRTITVGRSKLWVWDKSHSTVTIAKKMSDWERSNLLKQIRRLDVDGMHFGSASQQVIRRSLAYVGFKSPRTARGWESWPEMLSKVFGFRVTVMSRCES